MQSKFTEYSKYCSYLRPLAEKIWKENCLICWYTLLRFPPAEAGISYPFKKWILSQNHCHVLAFLWDWDTCPNIQNVFSKVVIAHFPPWDMDNSPYWQRLVTAPTCFLLTLLSGTWCQKLLLFFLEVILLCSYCFAKKNQIGWQKEK